MSREINLANLIVNLKGCALLPPGSVGNLQIELVPAEIKKSLSKDPAKHIEILPNRYVFYFILSFVFVLFYICVGIRA